MLKGSYLTKFIVPGLKYCIIISQYVPCSLTVPKRVRNNTVAVHTIETILFSKIFSLGPEPLKISHFNTQDVSPWRREKQMKMPSCLKLNLSVNSIAHQLNIELEYEE